MFSALAFYVHLHIHDFVQIECLLLIWCTLDQHL